MTRLEDRKTQLLERRKELATRLHAIEEELDSHQSKDWEELAVEREEDEVLENLGEAGIREVEMIDLALKRMDEGEYGVCQRCGEEISEARLDLLPFTPLCRNCAATV